MKDALASPSIGHSSEAVNRDPSKLAVHIDRVDPASFAEKERAGGKDWDTGKKEGMRPVSGWLFVGLAVVLMIVYYIEKSPYNEWDARATDAAHVHDWTYYAKCACAGSLACASHVVLIPLDVVKVNMQYDPQRYKTLRQSFFLIAHEFGWGTKGLWKGASFLVAAFGKQGVIKFGLYEFLKDSFMNYLGRNISMLYTGYIWLAAACVAELYADLALCPCEMVKVKVQTAPHGTFPTSFIPALKRFYKERHENGFPFGAIEAVWSRQIPYTMAKFFVFEFLVRFAYTHILTEPKDTYTTTMQLSVTVIAGFLTGLTAALVSHIPDTLFSIKGKPENISKTYGQLVKDYGLFNLATNGLPTRMFVIGCLTAVQWYTYDRTKVLLGLPTTATILKTPAPLPPA